MWKFDRSSGYVSQNFLGSYNPKIFKDRVRVNKPIYLCHLFGPMLSKKDTKLRFCIPIECRIYLTLHRLATGDTLHTLADLYGILKSSASIIVRKICEGIKSVLRPLVFS